jgi:hypothetical protein
VNYVGYCTHKHCGGLWYCHGYKPLKLDNPRLNKELKNRNLGCDKYPLVVEVIWNQDSYDGTNWKDEDCVLYHESVDTLVFLSDKEVENWKINNL